MIRNNSCVIKENVPRMHNPSTGQFLKQIMHEEEKIKQIEAQEILMNSASSRAKEEKETEQICKELQIIERKKFLEEKHRLLMHQNEDEIRELDVQIKRANIQKELLDQKALKEKKLKEDFKNCLEENKRVAEELQHNRETSLQNEIENAQKKNAFRQELLKQMQEKDKQREIEKEMIIKEREERKKLLENMQKEMENEKQEILKTKEILRKERDDYLEKMELFNSQQKSDAEEDHRKYLEWVKQRDEEERMRKEQLKQATKMREALSENIGKQIFTIQEENQKREGLLLELLIGERLAKDDERHRLNLDKQRLEANKLRDDFLTYFEEKRQETFLNRKGKQLDYQEQLKISQNLAKAENDLKLMKIPRNKQLREELLNTIEHQKHQRELEAQQHKAAYEQQLSLQKKRQKEIEAEKLRLLREQPVENFKFLPRKAISEEHRLLLGLTCKEKKEITN